MQKLEGLNGLGMAAALLLAGAAAALGISAAVQGVAHPLPLLPPRGVLHLATKVGGGGGPHAAASEAASLAGVLAVVLTAFVGHQSMHPVLPLLQPYTAARMCGVCAAALGAALTIYLVLSVGACLAFGYATQADVLVNFSVAAMTPLLGGRGAAVAAALAVQGCYAVTIMASFALFVHPLRTAVAELIWDRDGESGADGDAGAVGVNGLDSSVLNGGAAAHHAAGGGGGGVEGGSSSSVIADTEAASAAASAVRGGVDELDAAVKGPAGSSAAAAGGRVAAMEARHYLLLTYSILAAATLTAILVPSEWLPGVGGGRLIWRACGRRPPLINLPSQRHPPPLPHHGNQPTHSQKQTDVWKALAAIGNTAASIQAFIVPGLIALALRRQRGAARAASGGEGSAGGPLSFPLLFESDDDADTPTAAAVAAVQSAAEQGGVLGDGFERRSRSSSGTWVSDMTSAGETVLIGGVLVLGAALLINGVVQLLPVSVLPQ